MTPVLLREKLSLCVTQALVALLIGALAVLVRADEPPVDFAHVGSGTTVHDVSEGVNPPPYDVRGAIGDGSHLSYPGALPNWFELDLGQVRSIRSIEIDWRYHDKSADDFDLSFGLEAGRWTTTLQVRDIGGQGRYWYRILDEPIRARYVRMEVLSLHNYQWTVLNRFSLYGTSRIPRLVEANRERYEWLSRRLQRLAEETAEISAIVPAALRSAADEATRFDDLLAREADIMEDQWRGMEAQFRDLQQTAYEAEARLSFARLRRDARGAAAVGAVSAMEKVFRDIWPAENAGQLRLQCARNERESGQVLVAAVREDLADVTVRCDPLHGPVTLEDAVELGLVCYVRTRDAPFLTHHVGLWPDGISPVAAFDLPRGRVQPIWLTVAIPEDAPAGEYTGAVHIRPQGLGELTVPVRVRVWDFTLPTRISLPNVFSMSSLLVDAWYRGRDFGWEDLKQHYYDFWLEHRLNPTSLYGQMQPPPEDLDVCLAGGMSAFVIKYIYSAGHRAEEDYFQEALEELAEWDEILAERGLYDEALVYLADEPAEKQSVTDEINRRASIIGERFPQMRRLLVLTRPIDRAFDGNVDVWCPIVGAMRPEDVTEAHRRGEQCWWYTVGHFFDLDVPSVAARSMPWLTYRHRLDGILYWSIQSSWRRPNRPASFHPKPGDTVWEAFEPAGHGGHNGIGNMCYPGHDGRPWSSQRLEILREGMEDYEYLVLLEDALEDSPASLHRRLLEVPEEVRASYPIGADAGFLLQRRTAIGEALHELAGR
ncbi:MAG: glycoside hydrolase domain-containing protein [Armatimonadota bacterium]